MLHPFLKNRTSAVALPLRADLNFWPSTFDRRVPPEDAQNIVGEICAPSQIPEKFTSPLPRGNDGPANNAPPGTNIVPPPARNTGKIAPPLLRNLANASPTLNLA